MLFPFLQPDAPYYASWADMRRRRTRAWRAFFMCGPLVLLICGPLVILGGAFGWDRVGRYLIFLVVLPIVGRVWWLGISAGYWPCPRCGNPFYIAAGIRWWFADNCLHCGLPEFAPHGEYNSSL